MSRACIPKDGESWKSGGRRGKGREDASWLEAFCGSSSLSQAAGLLSELYLRVFSVVLTFLTRGTPWGCGKLPGEHPRHGPPAPGPRRNLTHHAWPVLKAMLI